MQNCAIPSAPPTVASPELASSDFSHDRPAYIYTSFWHCYTILYLERYRLFENDCSVKGMLRLLPSLDHGQHGDPRGGARSMDISFDH